MKGIAQRKGKEARVPVVPYRNVLSRGEHEFGKIECIGESMLAQVPIATIVAIATRI